MKKYLLIITIAIITISICSCKKSAPFKSYSTLIVGTWLAQSDNVKAYSINNNQMVFDTTYSLIGPSPSFTYLFVFNNNGTAYNANISGSDTSGNIKYTISGNNLVYTEFGGTTQYTDLILQLNTTTFELSTAYIAPPPLFYKSLDPNATYKFVETIRYKRK